MTTPVGAALRLVTATLMALALMALTVVVWNLHVDIDRLQTAARRVEEIAPTVSKAATAAAAATSELTRFANTTDAALRKANDLAAAVTTKSKHLQDPVTATQKSLDKVRLVSGTLGAESLTKTLGSLDAYLMQASDAAAAITKTSSALEQTIPTSLPPSTSATLEAAAKTLTQLAATADQAGPKAGHVADRASTWWTVLLVTLVTLTLVAVAYLARRIWLHRRWQTLRRTQAETVVTDAIRTLTPTAR